MTPFQQGYAVGEQCIAEKGLRVAQDIALSTLTDRYDMRTSGFRVAVDLATEKHFTTH